MTTIVSALLTVCSVALAQTLGIAPGEYIMAHGWGTLKVQPNGKFTLESIGVNGHSCSLAGTIRRGRAKVDDIVPPDTCELVFKTTAKGIDVSDNRDMSGDRNENELPLGCRVMCGARADFPGEYLKPAPGCTTAAFAARRRKFSTLYAAKAYEQAATTLRSLLEQCSATSGFYQTWQMRNDLAITEYHLQHYAACLEVLQPVIEDARDTDEQLEDSLPPVEYELHVPLAHATRYNVKMCQQTPR